MIFKSRADRRRQQEERRRQLEADEKDMTPGARRRILDLEHKWRGLVKAVIAAGVLFMAGFALTGWQITVAFNKQDEERLARVSASASINTFLCQRIDAVGNGVAALVTVSLKNSPPPEALPPKQREGYEQFAEYAEEQERPPRCRELALKIATLTGADPEDVKITPIKLHDSTPKPRAPGTPEDGGTPAPVHPSGSDRAGE